MRDIQKSVLKNNIVIIATLITSFLFVYYISPKIFLGFSPQLNPQFIAVIKDLPRTLANLPKTIVNSVQQSNNQSARASVSLRQLEQLQLKQVTKGVYAGELGKIKYYRVSQSEVEWEQIELQTKSGKVVKLRYPKGQPPTQEMLDIIKSE